MLDNLSLSDSGEGTIIMVGVENLVDNFRYNSSSLKVEVLQIFNDPFSVQSLWFYASTLVSLSLLNLPSLTLKMYFALKSFSTVINNAASAF